MREAIFLSIDIDVAAKEGLHLHSFEVALPWLITLLRQKLHVVVSFLRGGIQAAIRY